MWYKYWGQGTNSFAASSFIRRSPDLTLPKLLWRSSFDYDYALQLSTKVVGKQCSTAN